MKLMVPLNSSSELKELVNSGADAFFCGLYVPHLRGTKFSFINRRHTRNENFSSMKDLCTAIDIAHKYKKEIYLTLNEHFYDSRQKRKVCNLLSQAVKWRIDGIIIANLSLLLHIKKHYPPLKIVSGVGFQVQNSDYIKFLKKQGVKHIIFPRHMKLSEIKELTREFRDIEFECFIKNENCPNEDGLCSYGHGVLKPTPICTNLKAVNSRGMPRQIFNNFRKTFKNIRIDYCGLCTIYHFYHYGVAFVKLLGRASPLSERIRDTRFIHKLIKDVKVFRDSNSFKKHVTKEYKKYYGKSCRRLCYYDA